MSVVAVVKVLVEELVLLETGAGDTAELASPPPPPPLQAISNSVMIEIATVSQGIETPEYSSSMFLCQLCYGEFIET